MNVPQCSHDGCTDEAVDRVLCAGHLIEQQARPISVDLEKKLAYCFGVPDREAVLEHFIAALKHIREFAMRDAIAELEAAYQVVHDNGWPHINVEQAASDELEMIMAFQHNASEYEGLVEGMMDLYAPLYERDREDFRRAAKLRTLAYLYKRDHGETLCQILFPKNKISTLHFPSVYFFQSGYS